MLLSTDLSESVGISQLRDLADKVFLTDDQAKAREQEIANKEKEATELRMRYFGPEGQEDESEFLHVF